MNSLPGEKIYSLPFFTRIEDYEINCLWHIFFMKVFFRYMGFNSDRCTYKTTTAPTWCYLIRLINDCCLDSFLNCVIPIVIWVNIRCTCNTPVTGDGSWPERINHVRDFLFRCDFFRDLIRNRGKRVVVVSYSKIMFFFFKVRFVKSVDFRLVPWWTLLKISVVLVIANCI